MVRLVNQKYFAKKELVENPAILKQTHLIDIDSKITAPFLDTIVERYKGKLMYIDFWGPWCMACLDEMPESLKRQKEYMNKNVAFLYFACRSKKNIWKAKISEMKLTGEHYLLSDDQYKVLARTFDISGLPHYVLINKNGKIADINAPRPSEKENLRKAINKYLAN